MRMLALFIAIPLIEIALFIEVGGFIGLWPTLVIVVATAIAGTWLVRTQGIAAINDLRGSFSELRDPSDALAHGAMILISGALLLTPGFFTDAVGFALLVPGLRRHIIAKGRERFKMKRFEMGQQPRAPGPPPQGQRRAHPSQGDIVEGEFQEVDLTKRPTHPQSGWTKH